MATSEGDGHVNVARLPAWKVILVGEEGVGKSSIYRRIHHHYFDANRTSTVGIDHCTVPVNIGGRQCRLDLWDTGGSERHQSMTMSYYRRAAAVLFVFALDSTASLVKLEHWARDARMFAPDALMFVVGNKHDLIGEGADDLVGDDMVQGWVHDKEEFVFQEPVPVMTSAKTNEGVDDLFKVVCLRILEKIERKQKEDRESDEDVEVIGDDSLILGFNPGPNFPPAKREEETQTKRCPCTIQ